MKSGLYFVRNCALMGVVMRRNAKFMLALAVCATLLANCMKCFGASARKPNIIFVLADDLGYGDLVCYGQKKFATPNIDKLATGGVRFTQVYAGAPVCAPSRCSLLTGLHTGHAFIRGNKPGGGVPLRADPEDITVAEVLKLAGYATGGFGKWGLGLENTTGDAQKKGFDEWFGYLDQTQAHNYYPDYLIHNSERVPLDGRQYSHDLIVKSAFDFIRQNEEKPFFLYLAVTIPHASLEVPEDSLKKYLGKFPETPFRGNSYASQAAPHAAYAAMIDRLDGNVGQMMALLKELGIDDNTIVFFTSDNGPHREGGGDPDFFDSNGPLRGGKRDLYEGGIREPMIARWPGRIKPDTTSKQVWAFWDFLPTAAEIAGVKSPTGIDGISMLPALLGKEQKSHDYLYWEFHERGFQQAIRMGDWKAVRLAAGRPLELYDLATDVGEEHNVASQHAHVVAKIDEILKSCRTDSKLWPSNAPASRNRGE